MKISEASFENSVLENKLILLDEKIKRLKKPPLFKLMERNLETTELKISLESPTSASLKKKETGSEMAQVEFQGRRREQIWNRFSVSFHHTSVANKAQNSLWNLLTQDSSTRVVFWNVKESTYFLGDGERKYG